MIARLRDGLVGFVLGLLIAAGICAWRALQPSAPAIPAAPAAELKGEKPTTLACQPVVVYRDRVRDRLGVPEKAGHVTASANIPAADRPYTATATYSPDTGATSLYIREDPLPWLAFDRRWTVGAFYGARDDQNGPVGEAVGFYELAQFKAVHLGALGHLDTTGRRFGGVGVWVSGR